MEIEIECFVRRFLQFTIDLLEVDIESEGSVKHSVKYEIVFETFATYSADGSTHVRASGGCLVRCFRQSALHS